MKQILFAYFFIVFSQFSYSQNLSPYQLSNNSGVYGLNYNPASIADTRYSYHLNLGGFASSFGKNLLDNSYLPFSKKTYSLSKSEFKTERIDILGPSLMIQLPKGSSFAISTKYRAGQHTEGANISNIFENKGENFTDARDNYSSVSAKEIAISYAHPFAFKDHFLKVGGSYKLLAMSNLTEIVLSKASLNYTNNIGQLNGDLIFQNSAKSEELKIGNLLKTKNSGSGTDFGFIYEFRPKHEDYSYKMDGKTEYDAQKSKYLLKFAFSVMDIGSFDGSKIDAGFYKANISNFKIDDPAVGKSIVTDLSKLPLDNAVTIDGTYLVNLPKRINLFLDTKLGNKGWYMGAFINSFTKKTLLGDRQNLISPSQIVALIPRYEKNGFDFSMPIVYQKETKKYGLGLQLNLGSLFLGTESLNSFFQKNAPNPTIYAGFAISKLGKTIKDTDGDGVSDKVDICPDIKGLWAFKGCPDTDGDGIKDSEDDCPEHAGPKETKGCPDTDKDGIFDKNDACPNAAGPTKFNGCPDTDNDGLPDNEDECPTKAGSAEFGGCPDTDKDGLMDNEDECPELPGIKLLKGCPDTDGDGIADKYDTCPNAKGSLANKGCPDTDGDGLIDKEDNCPTETGKKELGGCPDTDNDGIKNSEDKCPNIAGTKAMKGCPDTDSDGIADNLDACPTEKGLNILDGCNIQNLTFEFDVLKSLTKEIIEKNIAIESIKQVEGLLALKNNAIIILAITGNKSSQIKPIIEATILGKLGSIKYEILEEKPNLKSGLEIRIK